MKTYMTPEEHARLHRRRARQTLGLLIAVLAVGAIITLAFFAARACRVGSPAFTPSQPARHRPCWCFRPA